MSDKTETLYTPVTPDPYSAKDPFSARPQPNLEEIQETLDAIQSSLEAQDEKLDAIQDSINEQIQQIEDYTYAANRYPPVVPSDDE